MVGGINPANLSKARHTRGTTAENPIVVEDESLPRQPFIGKRPLLSGSSTLSQLPRPTSEQILGSLLQQKNIIPIVVSLLRLLVPGAPSLATTTPNYPQCPPPPPVTFIYDSRSQSPEYFAGGDVSAPPVKRRKLNTVPAGAADWDVPYPFPQGHGPENYRETWERERGKQLLADLMQLVQGSAQKAAAKAWYQQRHYGREPTVNKYYRPKTMYYGLERGPAAYPRPPYLSRPLSEASGSHTSGSSTPSVGTSSSLGGVWSTPSEHAQSTQSSSDASHLSSAAFDQLVESLLVAQQDQNQRSSDSVDASAPSDVSGADANATASTFATDESTQAFFDNWLEMLAAMPPGDPNEAGVGSPGPLSATSPSPALANSGSPAPSSVTTTPMPMAEVQASSQIPDCLIDPSLLHLTANTDVSSHPSAPSTSAATDASATTTRTTMAITTGLTQSQPSATPSLVYSPAVTATSLTDPADVGPATPSFDWTFPDMQDMPTTQDIKLLEQWAGMDIDVDVDALFETHAAVAPDQGLTITARVADSLVDQQLTESNVAAAAEQEGAGASLQPGRKTTPQPVSLAESQLESRLSQQDFAAQTQTAPNQQPSVAVFAAAPGQSSSHPHASLALPMPYVPAPELPSHPHAPPQSPAFTFPVSAMPSPASTSAQTTAPFVSVGAKGKAKAIPGTGNVSLSGTAAAAGAGGKQGRKATVERARKMRAALVAEVERAKIALWETTLEQGVLVAMGRELDKLDKGKGKGR